MPEPGNQLFDSTNWLKINRLVITQNKMSCIQSKTKINRWTLNKICILITAASILLFQEHVLAISIHQIILTDTYTVTRWNRFTKAQQTKTCLTSHGFPAEKRQALFCETSTAACFALASFIFFTTLTFMVKKNPFTGPKFCLAECTVGRHFCARERESERETVFWNVLCKTQAEFRSWHS